MTEDVNKARQNNVAIHPESLTDLCHHKHSELAQALCGDKSWRHGWRCRQLREETLCVSQQVETLRNISRWKETPCIGDHQLNPHEFRDSRWTCCSVLADVCRMLTLCGPDMLWSVSTLAKAVTKCTKACDTRLAKLSSHIGFTRHHRPDCFVGDIVSQLRDSKSTSACVMCVFGPHTFVPISWMCKKQNAVSQSGGEARVTFLDTGVWMEGLQASSVWDCVLDVLAPPFSARSSSTTHSELWFCFPKAVSRAAICVWR